MNQQQSAVILARVSSKTQEDEGYSLDSQLKLLQGYCDKQNLNVVQIFKIAETASKEQSRKVFHELLEYLTKAKVYHLTVEKTDRFTRNFRDAVAIDDWLEQNEDRRLHAVKENLLLHKNAKSDVKFMWNIHLSVAKKYTDNLREEAMKGWAEKLAQGWLPAPPPPGYMTVTEGGKRIHVPNPETKSIIQHAFKKYLEPNHSLATITKELELMGIRSKQGRPHPKSRVQKILNNPFYIGTNRFNGKDYPGAQEHLISKSLFEAVQNKMHKGRPIVFSKHNPVFKGVIRCEDCGTLITWQLQKGRFYGVCKRANENCKHSKMLREDAIEKVITKMLEKLVCPSPEIIDWVADAIQKQRKSGIENSEKLIASIQLQIDRTERMLDTLYDDKLAGDIPQAKYEEKHKQLIDQKAELSSRLNNIDKASGRALEYHALILRLSQKAAELYPKKSPEQKRLIMSKLFSNLTIKGGVLSVEYTKLAQAIAKKVQTTYKIMEEYK